MINFNLPIIDRTKIRNKKILFEIKIFILIKWSEDKLKDLATITVM